MAKQEEVRDGIQGVELGIDDLCGFLDGHTHLTAKGIDKVLQIESELGVVIGVDVGFPKKLTNNIGCMSKKQIEDFASMVLEECGYPHRMEWTTAGDILIGEIIYIDERHIDEYPYMAKERVLHEVAHIDTHPQDDRHGEIFHRRLAELINRFMAGYVVEPLMERIY